MYVWPLMLRVRDVAASRLQSALAFFTDARPAGLQEWVDESLIGRDGRLHPVASFAGAQPSYPSIDAADEEMVA